MEFIIFKFSNGKYLKDIESIDDDSCDGFSVTDDIELALHLTKDAYYNFREYFDVFDGYFTKFKVTEVGKCN